MRQPSRQPLAPLDLHPYRLASFLGALAFVSSVVLAFFTDHPLVAAFGAGAFAACILYLRALLWITRRM